LPSPEKGETRGARRGGCHRAKTKKTKIKESYLMRGRLLAVLLVAALVLISFGSTADADHRTVRGPTGVIKYDQANTQPGYLDFSLGRNAYLVDMEGYIVHTWTVEDTIGYVPQITDQGHALLQRGGGFPMKDIEEQNWDGDQVRVYATPTTDVYGAPRLYQMHHRTTFYYQPGNVHNRHVFQQSYQTYTQAEAIALGRTRQTGSTFRPDTMIEFNNGDPPQRVWEWQVVDHLGAAQYNKIDPNYPTPDTDFTHTNSTNYDSVRNWVMFSSNAFSEFFCIDYNTKDIVYRFGNPANWNPAKQYVTADATRLGAISLNDRWDFNNHDVRPTVPGTGGTIMILNNGLFPTGYGAISYEVDPDQDKVTWRWPGNATATTANNGANLTIQGGVQSGAQRLPNGNTLLSMASDGHAIEVTSTGSVVWEYKLPFTSSGARCFYDQLSDNYGWHAAIKIPADYPGLTGRDLVTGRYRFKDCPFDANPEWAMAEPADPAAPTVTIIGARNWTPPADLLIQVQIDGTENYDVYFDIQLPGSTNRYYLYTLNTVRTDPNSRVYFMKNTPAGTYNAFQFPFRSLGTDYTIPVRCQVYRAGHTSVLTTATGTVVLGSY
jgi:hypothetical protein